MFGAAFRRYSLHEFHSKVLMANYGLNVQKGFTAFTPSEARYLADRILTPGEYILKANV
jgi:succinyl-CoA synthetase beta subunit